MVLSIPVSQNLHWTGGVQLPGPGKPSDNWYWEATRNKVHYSHFNLSSDDITYQEKEMWDGKRERKSDDRMENMNSMMSWLPRGVATQHDQCILLGPSTDPSRMIWHKKPCLGHNAHFICRLNKPAHHGKHGHHDHTDFMKEMIEMLKKKMSGDEHRHPYGDDTAMPSASHSASAAEAKSEYGSESLEPAYHSSNEEGSEEYEYYEK